MPNGFIAEARRFYYDLAGAANAGAVASLLHLVTPSNVLFGTDFPPGGTSLDVARDIRALNMLSPTGLELVERGNALRLIPRLQG